MFIVDHDKSLLGIFREFTWNPEPESGTTIGSVAMDANLSTAVIDNVLADTEAETCALNAVVELDESVEDAGLFVTRDAGTRVFTIDVKSAAAIALLNAVSDFDVPLVGILDGVGDEVGNDLLNTSPVEDGRKGFVGIVLHELYTRLFHMLGHCVADVVKRLRKIDVGRFYSHA